MKYRFINEYRSKFHVVKMCRVLEVSSSGYYDWLKNPVSEKKRSDAMLTKKIIEAHESTRKIYGSKRLCEELNRRGTFCGKNRVARLMKQNGIRSKRIKKFKATTNSSHNLPVAPNLLNQDFNVQKNNQVWVSDITYIPTGEGWLYLAAIVDLYNRKVVGWAMNSTMTRELVIAAFRQAIWRYRPPAGVIHHSDRGSQYASHEYRGLLKAYGFQASMSRKGNCYDNASMESFFGSLKTELIYLTKFKTRAEARLEVFEYIEIFYNRVRLHSSLGYKTPDEYVAERLAA